MHKYLQVTLVGHHTSKVRLWSVSFHFLSAAPQAGRGERDIAKNFQRCYPASLQVSKDELFIVFFLGGWVCRYVCINRFLCIFCVVQNKKIKTK